MSKKQTYHRTEDTKIVLGTMSRQKKMRKEPEKAGGVMRLQHKSDVSEGGKRGKHTRLLCTLRMGDHHSGVLEAKAAIKVDPGLPRAVLL